MQSPTAQSHTTQNRSTLTHTRQNLLSRNPQLPIPAS